MHTLSIIALTFLVTLSALILFGAVLSDHKDKDDHSIGFLFIVVLAFSALALGRLTAGV